eukprot:390968-Pelagomonas_calceolata.AAC.2
MDSLVGNLHMDGSEDGVQEDHDYVHCHDPDNGRNREYQTAWRKRMLQNNEARNNPGPFNGCTSPGNTRYARAYVCLECKVSEREAMVA